ncbi:MAG: DUF1549 and DUF1553 domain-containing protein [Bryobacteraceae bacterium]|nr:DUF1549 and DUF1553 domain-containing protein [Bryobacteraceae bacterium]
MFKPQLQAAVAVLICPSLMIPQTLTPEEILEHANCVFYGPRHDTFALAGVIARGGKARATAVDGLTSEVAARLETTYAIPGGSRTNTKLQLDQLGLVDRYTFQAMNDAGVAPAELTSDAEFCRRVSLDLTGRIPTADRLLQFLADPATDKRPKYVEELLASPAFVDKWTMYFGDHLQNNSENSQIRRYDSGVTAFNNFIRSSVQSNKPYDQWVREMLTATGANSYEKGELNYLIGGVVSGTAPVQDIYDQQTANIAKNFLGIAHMDCVLCHNGRGHLDTLSLWGRGILRTQAWQQSSYLSRTNPDRVQVTAGQTNPYYWSISENTGRSTRDYQLNTTTGNRPARAPLAGQPVGVTPRYLFTDTAPNPGENYRMALARQLTADPQFSRATVNYLWAYFFGRGIVDPPDQFDPLRQDPNNPPPAPWVLQPSHPELLNQLGAGFVDSKYDLKWIMRTIVNSQTYQLSARYSGTWNPDWEKLFARHNVRRLWGEEVHDALALSTNILPSYTIPNYGAFTFAMTFPEPLDTPGPRYANVVNFLDSFLRGDRDTEARRPDGSIAQALSMMNDPYVMMRVQSNGPATSLLVRNLSLPNDQLITNLFLAVLSRYPTAAERTVALANLSNASTRSAEAENLLWSLFNKVDFLFNY